MYTKDVARLAYNGRSPKKIAELLSTREVTVTEEEVLATMQSPSYPSAVEAYASLCIPKIKDLPPPPESYTFRVTAEIFAYERGMGKCIHCYDEYIEAADWDDAKRQAEALTFAKIFRWTKWRRCTGGYEKNRTARDFTNSWLRVDPA